MKILIDADACPVVRISENIAKKYNIPVILLCDTSHVLSSDYSQIKIISSGADAVDFALANMCEKGDIAVTQDYGVAAMVLGKGGYAIHQSGRIFTNENIDGLLMERHIAKKARMARNKNHIKGPKKRTSSDDKNYQNQLESLILSILK